MSELIEGLKWLRRRVQSPWLFWPLAAVIVISAATFGAWESLPEKLKERIATSAVTPSRQINGVYIERFTTAKSSEGDADVQFLRAKTERNIAKLLWTNHVLVGSSMRKGEAPETAYKNRITGYVGRTPNTMVTIHVELKDSRDILLASGELSDSAANLKAAYESIPEALLYAAGINPLHLPVGAQVSPPRSQDPTRPTATPEAYLHLAEGQRLMGMHRADQALAQLTAVIQLEPTCATAWWSQGEVYRSLHQDNAAEAAYAAADKISRDYPKPPIVSLDPDPWPYLLNSNSEGRWKTIGEGIRRIELSVPAVNISLLGWQFERKRFSLETRWSGLPTGQTAGDFLSGDGAVLAVNGGFFDMSGDDQLAPSGLLVVNHRAISRANSSSSGLLLVSGHSISIEHAKSASAVSLATNADFAMQSGPILVENKANGILSDDGQRQRRAALCLTQDSFTIIIIDGQGLSLFQLGQLLSLPASKGGFGCDGALNLDGGPSVQVSYAFNNVKETVPGLWNIADALVVKAGGF